MSGAARAALESESEPARSMPRACRDSGPKRPSFAPRPQAHSPRLPPHLISPLLPIRLKIAVTVSQPVRGVTVMPGLSTLTPFQLEMNRSDVRIEWVADG